MTIGSFALDWPLLGVQPNARARGYESLSLFERTLAERCVRGSIAPRPDAWSDKL
jgi:hypothetical protein